MLDAETKRRIVSKPAPNTYVAASLLVCRPTAVPASPGASSGVEPPPTLTPSGDSSHNSSSIQTRNLQEAFLR